MSDVVIHVEGLGKVYRIGSPEHYKALRDTLSNTFYKLFPAFISVIRGRKLPVSKISSNNLFWSLKDVSFSVKQGEVVGIIGPNGAGKTTCLKILSRIVEPTEGYVEVRGRVGSLLEVGTGFHPELTGSENIYLNGAILGMKKQEIKRKFDEIVAFAEIEKFIDTPVKRYSSGMYIRLAFAVAAHLEPEILLVDEVLSVGDASFQRKCLGKMESVAREGRTVLFVSHNMTAVNSLCQRAIWLEQGRIKKDSTVQDTVSSYLASIRKRQTVLQDYVPLLNHPGRRKGFDEIVTLDYCQLVNESGQPVLYLLSGHQVRVRIGYRMKYLTSNVTFVCIFCNSEGRRIAYCSNDIVGVDFDNLQINGVVECVIQKIPLLPGIYSIDLGCKVSNAWSDFIYEAIEFEVIDGGFYTSKLLPPEEGGNILMEYTWNSQ